MKIPTLPWRCLVFIPTALVLGSFQPVFAQIEGSIVAKRGAVIRGTVEGSLLLVKEEAVVTLDPQARVSGDLVLPAEKSVPPSGKNGVRETLVPGSKARKSGPSSRTTVNMPDQTVIKGRERAAKRVALPPPSRLTASKGTESIVLTARQRSPDVSKLKDLTLQSTSEGMILPPRNFALPPGAYGHVVINHGSLILGTVGSDERTRYSFESLSVAAEGSITLLGPVVVIAGAAPKLAGDIGSSRFVNWLDLRVLSGDVALSGRMYGHLTALSSAVTLPAGSRLIGGLICDEAAVQAGARFTGIRPSWSEEATGNARPLFIHNAARLEQRVAELAEQWAGEFTVATSYDENDVPTIAVTPVRTTPSASRTQAAFLDMASALFDSTRFSTAKMMLRQTANSPEVAIPTDRKWFVDSVRHIGGDQDLRRAITAIRRDSALRAELFGKRPR